MGMSLGVIISLKLKFRDFMISPEMPSLKFVEIFKYTFQNTHKQLLLNEKNNANSKCNFC